MKQSLLHTAICGSLLCALPIGAQTSQTNDTGSDTGKLQDLETLVVISSRIQEPLQDLATSVTYLDEIAIAARYSPNLANILRTAPGVSVSNSGGVGKNTSVRIRGEEAFRTQVYFDGVALADPTAPQVTPIFDDIMSHYIGSIEILRGSQGFAYGADAGGIINIRSKSPQQGFAAQVSGELGSYDSKRHQASISSANQSGSLLLYSADLRTDGFNAQTSDTSNEADGYQNQTSHFSGQYRFNEHFGASVVIRNNDGKTEYDGCFHNTTFAATNDCITQSDYQTTRLAGYYQSEDTLHEFSWSESEVNREFFSNGEFGFSNKGVIRKFDYVGSHELGKQTFVYGADVKTEKDENNNASRDNHGIFAEYKLRWHGNSQASLGLRYDDNDTFGSKSSFRLSGVHHFTGRQIRLKASLGTGFRAPSLFEQAYNDGPFAFGDAAGLQLQAEASQGFDLGVAWQATADTWLSATFFDQKIENEIIFDPIGFQGYLQETGTSDSRGIELELEHQFNNQTALWFNYTYNKSDYRNGEDRLRRPEQVANLGVQHALLDNTLNLSVYGRSQRGAVDIGGIALDNYTTWNANINWQINHRFDLQLRLDNLFDKDYQEVLGFNSAGQTTALQITASF